MYRVGGYAGFSGITFQSHYARVKVTGNRKGEYTKVFSWRTGGILAYLAWTPLVRGFAAFGRMGTIVFLILFVLALTDLFYPRLLSFEIEIPDIIFYALLVTAIASLLAMRDRFHTLFAYHGAEHMALNTYKSGQELSLANIAKAGRATPNCGSMFVLTFLPLAIPFIFIPDGDYFIPLVFVIAYELNLLARRARRMNPLLRFGLWVQERLLTRKPTMEQMETARRGLVTLLETMEKAGIRDAS